MLKEKMLVPQLRFSEFEEQWIMEEFRKIANKRKKRFNPKESDKNFPCIELECLSQETGILLKKFDSKYQKSIKNIFSKEDILFGKLRPYLRKFLKPDFDGVCSSEIWVLNGKKVINDYLYFLIQTDRFNYQVNQTSGSKMPRADWDYISQIKFNYPQSKEQQKIANFLTSIDNRIQTLEKKKTLLEQYKKGVMQKIFKQELRFKDDTSTTLKASDGKEFPEWEEKKFSKFIKLYRGSSPRPINRYLTKEKSGVNWIKIGDTKASRNYLLESVSEKITVAGSLKSRKVRKGELILANSMSFGKTYILNIDGCIYDGWFVLREFGDYFEKRFLIQQLNSEHMQRQYKRLSTGGVVQNISSAIVYSTKLRRPSLKEQTKIANFLSAIDRNIELVTKKIEHTKTYKKGLLQQMFV